MKFQIKRCPQIYNAGGLIIKINGKSLTTLKENFRTQKQGEILYYQEYLDLLLPSLLEKIKDILFSNEPFEQCSYNYQDGEIKFKPKDRKIIGIQYGVTVGDVLEGECKVYYVNREELANEIIKGIEKYVEEMREVELDEEQEKHVKELEVLLINAKKLLDEYIKREEEHAQPTNQ